MSAPEPLLSTGGDDFERALLRSAKKDHGSEKGYRQTLAAIGVGTAILSTQTGAAASTIASSTFGKSFGAASVLLKWLGIGMGTGLVTIATLQMTAPPPAPSSSTIANEVPVVQAPAVVVPAAKPLLPNPVVSAPTPKNSAPIRSTLRQEVAAIDLARSCLARGDSAGALAALSAFDERFPGASLSDEATVLKIQALNISGQRSNAIQLARDHLKKRPKSPHANQLRKSYSELTIP